MVNTEHAERARERMVTGQLIARGIRDEAVLEAIRKIPRHLFVPEDLRALAYDDRPLPIDRHQTISQPYMVALMTEALGLSATDRVLEVGTGSGYQAAVLAEICAEVYTIETFAELADSAQTVFSRLGYDNIVVEVADGSRGWPAHQPYQAIIVTAGAPRIPEPLFEQLDEDGGRMVVPVGDNSVQDLVKVTRKGSKATEEKLVGCRFVPLRGEFGWR